MTQSWAGEESLRPRLEEFVASRSEALHQEILREVDAVAVAVAEKYYGKGVGSELIDHAARLGFAATLDSLEDSKVSAFLRVARSSAVERIRDVFEDQGFKRHSWRSALRATSPRPR